MDNTIVEVAEIPQSLAERLSKLLVKESIRRQLLNDSLNDPAKYELAEERLIPIVSEINEIKHLITEKYIPDDFKSDRFIWSFDGIEIDNNHVKIYKQW